MNQPRLEYRVKSQSRLRNESTTPRVQGELNHSRGYGTNQPRLEYSNGGTKSQSRLRNESTTPRIQQRGNEITVEVTERINHA